MTQPPEPREVFPVQFFDANHPRPAKIGKDFAVRPMPSALPEIELEAEVAEEVIPDPKGFSATGSAEFLDLIPSAAEAIPVDADMDPEPTPTDLSKPTSSTSPESGRNEQHAVPAPVTTPTTGSAKPQKRATAPKQSASPAP